MRRIYIDHCIGDHTWSSVYRAELFDVRPIDELVDVLKTHWADPAKLIKLLEKTHTIVHLGEDMRSTVYEPDGSHLFSYAGGLFSRHWFFTLKASGWSCNTGAQWITEQHRWGN